MAMVDSCLNCQVTHVQFSCVHPCKSNKQFLIESPLFCKISYRAECISDFLQGPVTSSIFKNLLCLAVTSSGDNRTVANDSCSLQWQYLQA